MKIVELKNRNEFREWLNKNSDIEKECWIPNLKRGKPVDALTFYYLDAVEEALCFGWIDSVYKNVDGILYQKFSPRAKKSNWTILNIERYKRLEKLGLMTDKGRMAIPKEEYEFDKDIIDDIKKSGIYETFISFPILYQKIRVYNLSSQKRNSIEKYKKSFDIFVSKTKEGKTIGEWNDYGRLL